MDRRRKNILIVEDDPNSRLALKTVLEAQGYRAFGAASAAEAIQHLYRDLRPDIILLDLRLPGKGGEQFNAELRGNALFKNIPVIVTSAFIEEPFDRSKYAAVFDKPVDTTKLLEKISTLLQES